MNCIYRGEEFYSAIDFVREYKTGHKDGTDRGGVRLSTPLKLIVSKAWGCGIQHRNTQHANTQHKEHTAQEHSTRNTQHKEHTAQEQHGKERRNQTAENGDGKAAF